MTKRQQQKGKRDRSRQRKRIQLSIQLAKTMTPERLAKMRAASALAQAINQIVNGQPPAGR